MKTYIYNDLHGRMDTFRDNQELFLSERQSHSQAMTKLMALSVAKQQIDECYYFHSIKREELSDSFYEGFNAGKEYMALAIEDLLEELDVDVARMTLHAGLKPTLTIEDHVDIEDDPDGEQILDEENVVTFSTE